MENQQTHLTNLQVCVAKLRDFVNTVPNGAGETVNWEELNQNRDVAQMSLTHLASILGGGGIVEIDRDCVAYPKL
ncbi:MAG: hypothetical protein NT166_31085 [Candidatus Aminicenantes bacterium]|nr:hypothetical protein [Candidatus Aminicenantes bacterium]